MQATDPVNSNGSTLRGILKCLRDSLRGSAQDFTQGSLVRGIFLLSIPMALELFMESVFSLVDVFFVARLGSDAVSAVGITEAMVAVVFAAASGLGIASTIMVSRRMGERDGDGAALTAWQALLLGGMFSVLIATVGGLLAPKLLHWMGASPGMVQAGIGYTRIMFFGNASIVLITILNAIFRGAGDAVIAMRALALANLVNLILDPCLIFGLGPFPALGTTGAAVATTIGRSVGIAYQLNVLLRAGSRVRLTRGSLRWEWKIMQRMLHLALGMMVQILVGTASWLGLIRIVSSFGSVTLAGYTIAVRLLLISLLPSWGLCNAAATLVGQNLGAGRPDRAERAVWLSAFCNLGFMGCIGLFFILLANPLIQLFSQDPAVVQVGASCLRIISYGYALFGFGMVMIQALNGAGEVYTPLLMNVLGYWLIQLPLAYLLSRTNWGVEGIFWAIVFAQTFMAVGGWLIFKRGNWKRKSV